jgi:hypothetical protein
VGPADNDATTLNRSSSSDLRRRLIVPNSTASTGHATASSGVLPAVRRRSFHLFLYITYNNALIKIHIFSYLASRIEPDACMQILGVAHLVVSLGIMLAADKFLKKAFVAAGIKFPSALFGMFCVFSVLVVFDTFVPPLAKAFMNFFEPATMFIKRWLPVFYVPTLVVFPLAITEIPAASALKIFAITCMYYSRSHFSFQNIKLEQLLLYCFDFARFFSRWLVCYPHGCRIYSVSCEKPCEDRAYSRYRAREQAVAIFYIRNLVMDCYIRRIIWCCIFQSHGTWYHRKNMPSFPACC